MCPRNEVGSGGDVTDVATTTERSQSGAALEGFDQARLRQIVDVVADGITVQADDGRIVYANDAAAVACGFDSADDLVTAGREAILARFELLDEDGQPLDARTLPGARVLRGEPSSDVAVGFRIRATGEERWAIVERGPPARPCRPRRVCDQRLPRHHRSEERGGRARPRADPSRGHAHPATRRRGPPCRADPLGAGEVGGAQRDHRRDRRGHRRRRW